MNSILFRSFAGGPGTVETSGRTISGLCVPFDVPAEVNDGQGKYMETWKRGAFAKSIEQRGHRVKLLAGHRPDKLPIGRATHLEERSDGLHGEFHVSNTRDGNEALELINDGSLDGLSIGFRSVNGTRSRGQIVRTEAALMEVSVVAVATWDEARITAVRGAQHDPYLRLSLAEKRHELLRLNLRNLS